MSSTVAAALAKVGDFVRFNGQETAVVKVTTIVVGDEVVRRVYTSAGVLSFSHPIDGTYRGVVFDPGSVHG